MGLFDLFQNKLGKLDLTITTFRMRIDDVFDIKQIGVVVTGVIDKGTVYQDSEIIVTDAEGNIKFKGGLSGLEYPNKVVTSASEGESIGLKLGHVSAKKFCRGYFAVME